MEQDPMVSDVPPPTNSSPPPPTRHLSTSVPVLPIISQLRLIQSNLDEIFSEQQHSIIKVSNSSQKFEALALPYLQQRSQLIHNHLPHFWATAIANHPAVSGFITIHEAPIIKQALKEVRVVVIRDRGYHEYDVKLIFDKEKNIWFENEEIVKSYRQTESIVGLCVSKAPIQWKKGKRPGSELAFQQLPHTQDELNSDSVLNYQRYTKFFDWLESEYDDYELGRIFRESLWKDAIRFYFGEIIDESDIMQGSFS